MTAGPRWQSVWGPLGPRLAVALLPVAMALLVTWAAVVGAEEPPGAPARPKLPAVPQDPLVFGVYPVTANSVIDGDTLRTTMAKSSIRVLGIDTEEVFKKEADRKAAAADFAAYAKAKRGADPFPVKYGTPAGEAAKAFVQALMQGVTQVRLERDSTTGPDRGTYGRLLAHVIVLKPDGEVNLSEAVIRAGHSPYFIKYGRAARFDDLYRKAEAEARKAGRGIWADEGPAHYPDYDERCRWWTVRAQQVERWNKEHAAKADHVTLGMAGSDKKLRSLLGKEATVFGVLRTVVEGRAGDRHILLLGGEGRKTFGLVVFNAAVFGEIDVKALAGMSVTARGKISLYRDRPQIVIEKADQVRVAPR